MGAVVSEDLQFQTREEFEILFKTHYSPLCAYANQFLKDVDAAEEVVQEVMFKLWTNRKSIIITTSIKSYLFRAVRNGCLNVIKHLNVREEYKRERGQEGESVDDGGDTLIISELQQKIREAIDQLPMERRKVFILSRYDGMTYQQIAEKLDISVKTVENQMGKALKTLREELAEYLPWLILFFFDVFKD
jgi:RNA polymerase sigma-70 factor (ECF subfamily)